MSIILIDSTGRRGALVRMLETAATQQLGMVVEVIRPDKFRRTVEQHSFADAAVFVPVSQEGLFNGSNTAGITVSLAQSFDLAQLAVERAAKVILVNQPGDSLITGADAGAALVAGIAGIVDDRLLLTDRVLKSFLTHQGIHSRWETMLVVGETARRFRNVKAMFAEWDEDDANDYSLYASCFKACMALAQLDRLKTVRGQGRRYSYLQLARALNLAHTVTFFHLSEGDLRKVLSIIANRLIPSDSDRFRLAQL